MHTNTAQKLAPAPVYLHQPDALQRQEPQLHVAFNLIRQYSPLGNHLLKTAESGKVNFKKEDLKGKRVGFYRGDTVTTCTRNTVEEDVMALSHEIFHWMQPNSRADINWDYRSRLLCTLSQEAGAQTCAIRVVNEA